MRTKLKILWRNPERGPEPKQKTDAEWEEVARNNKADAEVTALIRLLDLERETVKCLRNVVLAQSNLMLNKISDRATQNKSHDWTAFSHNPKPPIITDE